MAALLRPATRSTWWPPIPATGETRVVARDVRVLSGTADVPEAPTGQGGALVVVGGVGRGGRRRHVPPRWHSSSRSLEPLACSRRARTGPGALWHERETSMTGFKNFILRGNLSSWPSRSSSARRRPRSSTAFTGMLLSAVSKVTDGKDPNFDNFARRRPGRPVLTALIAFLILAAVVYFFVVVPYTKAKDRFFPAEPAGTPADVALLEEIRDMLKAQNGNHRPPDRAPRRTHAGPAPVGCGPLAFPPVPPIRVESLSGSATRGGTAAGVPRQPWVRGDLSRYQSSPLPEGARRARRRRPVVAGLLGQDLAEDGREAASALPLRLGRTPAVAGGRGVLVGGVTHTPRRSGPPVPWSRPASRGWGSPTRSRSGSRDGVSLGVSLGGVSDGVSDGSRTLRPTGDGDSDSPAGGAALTDVPFSRLAGISSSALMSFQIWSASGFQ